MKCARLIKILTLVCTAIPVHIGAAQADVTVLAAASLRGALDEIATLSDTNVTLSYGGSGTIARQVSNGAPADVVILAHPRWMDWLATNESILPDSRVDVAQNSLVLIGPKGVSPLNSPDEIIARLGQDRLAMGQRDAVPAGIYAREWLEHIDQWDTLESQLAEVENVRLALALVARKETPLGIVYRSDAQAEPMVEIVYNIPESTHTQIKYPAAATTSNGSNFIALLSSPDASLILSNHGFSPPKTNQ